MKRVINLQIEPKLNTNILKEYGPIENLFIQGPSDTAFQINKGGIIILERGVFSLDLTGSLGRIVDLTFVNVSAKVNIYFTTIR